MSTQTRNKSWVWVIPLLLLIAWLASRMLNADMIYVDEFYTLRVGGAGHWGPLDLGEVWERTIVIDFAAGMGVVYYWIIGGWAAIMGGDVFSARLLSFFAGILSIAGMYRLGCRFFNPRVALYATVVFGTSAFVINFMHEARAYTLITLFSIVAIYLYDYVRTLSRDPQPIHYIALTASVTMLAYLHYVALAIVAAIGIFHLINFKRDARWWKMLASMVLGGVLFLPWLQFTLATVERGASDTNRHNTSMTATLIVAELARAFTNINIALGLLFAPFALKERTRSALFTWILLIVPLLLVFLVNTVIPFMVHLRYVIFLWIALSFIIALGIHHIASSRLNPIWVVVVWACFGVIQSLSPAFMGDMFGHIYRPPWQGMHESLEILQIQSAPDDLVIFHIAQDEQEPFMKFPLDHLMHGIEGRHDQLNLMNDSQTNSDNVYFEESQQAIGSAPFIWTLIIPEIPRTNLTDVVTEFILQTQYRTCATLYTSNTAELTLYAQAIGYDGEDAIFGQADNDLEHIRFHWLNKVNQSATRYETVIGYTFGDNIPPSIYSGGLHIVNTSGELVAQTDFGLPDQARPFGCLQVSIDISSLPTGEYGVYSLVYNWQNGERLSIFSDGESVLDDRVRVSTLVIE